MEAVIRTLLLLLSYSQLFQAQKLPSARAPGETLDTVDEFQISTALDEIFPTEWWAKNSAAIGFANENGYLLSNAQKFEKSGEIDHLLPRDIDVQQTGLILHLNAVFFFGPEGAVSYDIEFTDYKVVLAYSIPWNDLFYDNKFNAKVYKKTVPVDSDMVQHMLSEESLYWKPENGGGYEQRNEYGIQMELTMTDSDDSKIVIWVDSSTYNPYVGPELQYGCDYYGLFDKVCWRECDANNVGWQWTTKSCFTTEDCENPNDFTPDSTCSV